MKLNCDYKPATRPVLPSQPLTYWECSPFPRLRFSPCAPACSRKNTGAEELRTKGSQAAYKLGFYIGCDKVGQKAFPATRPAGKARRVAAARKPNTLS